VSANKSCQQQFWILRKAVEKTDVPKTFRLALTLGECSKLIIIFAFGCTGTNEIVFITLTKVRRTLAFAKLLQRRPFLILTG